MTTASSVWRQRTYLRVIVACVVLGVVAGEAQADDGYITNAGISDIRVDVHADVDWYGMFGVGVRGEFPILRDGLVNGSVRDELALSVGGDLLFVPFDRNYYTGGAYAIPIVAGQWNFYLGDHWSIFPELGVAVHLGFDDVGYGERAWLYATPDLGFGVRYHFDRRAALLLRVATPCGAQIGMTF